MLNELSDQWGRQLAAALGRPLTDSETAFASALGNLRRAEGISFLRLDGVKERCGIGRSQIYALIGEGKFPAPTRVAGTRVAVWPSDAIDTWIAEQLSGAAAVEA